MIGQVTALTRAVIYEISKDALSPLLKARPAIAEELSDTLASLQPANRTVLDHGNDKRRRIVTDVLGKHPVGNGAPGGIRTPDPRSRNPLLYPLSYGRDVRSLRIIHACFQEKIKKLR